MWNRRHRWIRRLTAGLAFAAIVAPSAQARIAGEAGSIASHHGQAAVEYNGYGYQHSPGVPVADQKLPATGVNSEGYVLRSGMWVRVAAQRPDDRAVRFSPQPIDGTLAVRPDDRATRFSPAPQGIVSGQQAPELVAQPSGAFDWSDAGIGAGLAVALMLLALGAVLVTRHAGNKSLAGA